MELSASGETTGRGAGHSLGCHHPGQLRPFLKTASATQEPGQGGPCQQSWAWAAYIQTPPGNTRSDVPLHTQVITCEAELTHLPHHLLFLLQVVAPPCALSPKLGALMSFLILFSFTPLAPGLLSCERLCDSLHFCLLHRTPPTGLHPGLQPPSALHAQ